MGKHRPIRTALPAPALVAAAVLCAVSPLWAGEPAQPGRYGDIGQALTALAIFGLLLLILGKFAWKPVIAQLKRREQEVGERIRDSERREKEAKEMESHYRARLERADAEAKQVIAKSVEQAAKAREEMLATAREEGSRSVEAAKAEIDQFKRAALADLQRAMAGLAVDVAEEIIRDELSSTGHDRLLAESLERIRRRGEEELMARRERQVESVMDPVGESLAGVYAEALLGQVPSDVEAEEVAAELDALVDLLDEVDGFEELLTAALLGDDERCEVVERIFHGRVSEPVEAVLSVMAHAGRLGLLRALRRVFRSALYRRQGKCEVGVTTAVPLLEPQRRRVIEALAETLKAEPVVTFHVDELLLGGMVVRVGDRVYDASVRSDLGRLQERLAEEIQLDLPGGDEPAGQAGGR